ncbi:hypothetical protein TrVGV298_005689 [Trichoderma virens]|nr:hypothetical protein TrVGV298_005689 [Trichoderma virens]
MAQCVQHASSEHLQTVLEDTNQVNSSELREIVKHNKEFNNGPEKAPPSEGTNPFTTSELRANTKHHKQPNHPADGEESSSACSGATIPFTSGEFKAILKRHEYNTRSKRKIGTSHPALQGPILDPGRPSKRDHSAHRGDPSKQAGVVDNDKPPKLDRFVDREKSSKQASVLDKNIPNGQSRVFEHGESSKQGSRQVAQVKRKPRTIQDANINKASETTQAGPSMACRQSIARATLKLGPESLINISSETIGMSQKRVLHTTREFALTQSQHDFGMKLHIAKLHSDKEQLGREGLSKPLRLVLFFDPNSDSVLLINNTLLSKQQMLIIKQLPISPGKRPTSLGYMEKTPLAPSSYRLFVSDGHVFDITVLPRRYVALKSGPRRQVMQSVKRTLEILSQRSHPSVAKRIKINEINDECRGEKMDVGDQSKGKGKEIRHQSKQKTNKKETKDDPRGKGKGKATSDASNVEETTDESNASTIVRIRPPSNDLIPASASPFPSSLDLRTGYVSAVNHPLEELQQNATIKIANATREEDYTLVRRDNIANQANTLVFKAHHSKIQGKLIAVKVWHSTSDANLIPSTDVKSIANISKYFLNELKNHLTVSEHPTIASLHSFDVRLLALYIEHIDAPNLAFYRDPGDNPYCTLDDSDAEQVLQGIAGALKFIHDKDVVHNDIKPANILYSKVRGPVLIDFGWSSDTKTIHTAGSPWYIPPEYQRHGTRGPAGDVFAFGVVMLYLMRGIPLPELLSPRLRWQIHHLRSRGPESVKASETMGQWLRIIRKTLQELPDVDDEDGGGILEAIVPHMVEFEDKDRLTAHDIIQTMSERAGRLYRA